jgi:hypothetical protein
MRTLRKHRAEIFPVARYSGPTAVLAHAELAADVG